MFVRLNQVQESESRYSGNETTIPTMVQPSQVRYFHPRKHGRVGTRLSMLNGSGLVVSDLFPDVQRAFGVAEADIVQTFAPQEVRQIESRVSGTVEEFLESQRVDTADDDSGDLGEDQ